MKPGNRAGYRKLQKEGSRKAKVLLVYPNVGSEAQNVSLYPPLSLLYLASYLKDFSVAIFDQRVDSMENFQALLEERPICAGFSVMTGPQIKFSLELAQMVKEKNIPTVFGGVHPSILPEQTKKDKRVDHVVVGEGEVSFRQLVETLLNGKKPNPIIASKHVDLDQSPGLPYEFVDVEKYVYSSAIEGRALPVLFSRGCPFACTFCCNPVITKRRWRTMGIGKAIGQLRQLACDYDLDSIIFWDENMTIDTEAFNELALSIDGKFKWYAQSRVNTLLRYDLGLLEKMGLWRLSCGIESGSPRILKKIRKEEKIEEYIDANRMLAKTKISTWYNYIVGFPEETIDDLRQTVKLAVQILDENPNANNSTFYILVPYPGTEITESFLESDMLPQKFADWADFGRYNFNVPWHAPEMLRLYERICFSSKFVGKKMLRLFPDNAELRILTERFSTKWRNFDFFDDKEWVGLKKAGWEVLKKIFKENAY